MKQDLAGCLAARLSEGMISGFHSISFGAGEFYLDRLKNQTAFRLNQTVFGLNQTVFGLNQTVFRLNRTAFRLNQTGFRLNRTVFGLNQMAFRLSQTDSGLTKKLPVKA